MSDEESEKSEKENEKNKNFKKEESSEDEEEEEEEDDNKDIKMKKRSINDDSDDSQNKSIEEEFQGINLKEEIKNKKLLPGKRKGIKLRGVAPGYKEALKREIKKQKKIKEKIFLELKRKRPVGKVISPMQALANKVLKKKITTAGDAVRFLEGEILNPDERTKNIISLIATSKVFNDRIVLSDRISDKPLFTYYATYYENVTSLTNDLLYLWMIYVNDIKGETMYDKETLKVFIEFMTKDTKLSGVYIVSSPTNFEGVIKKGYYQDYSGDFLALNLDSLTEEERAKVLSLNENKLEFTYENIDYIASGTRESCVIVSEGESKNVNKIYEDMKILKVEKENIEIGMKELQVKGKPKFLSCKIKGERFCPCFMILPKPINVAMQFKIQINHNTFFELLDKYFLSYDSAPFPPNVCYWDTLESFVDFMWVYYLTSRVKKKDDYEFFENTRQQLSNYEKYKTAFNYWKSAQLDLQKILYDFYNSFNTRVNYDRVISIKEKLEKYLKTRSVLMSDSSFEIVVNFVRHFQFVSNFMCNQFNSKCLSVADKLYDTIIDFEKGKYSSTKAISKVGIAIYLLSNTPDDNENMFPSFPFILSPGAFLGDIISEGVEDHGEYLETIVGRYRARNKKVQQTNKEMAQKFMNAAKNMTSYVKSVVSATINKVLSDMKNKGDTFKYTKDHKDILLEKAMESVNKDDDLRNKIELTIYSNMETDPDDIEFSNNALENIIHKEIDNIKIKDAEIEQKRKQKIINSKKIIKKELDNIKEVDENDDLNLGGLFDEPKDKKEKKYKSRSPEAQRMNLSDEEENIPTLRKNLEVGGKVKKTPGRRINNKKSSNMTTTTEAGQYSFTESQNPSDILTELFNKNQNVNFQTEKAVKTINDEIVPQRILQYLSTVYTIAFNNNRDNSLETKHAKTPIDILYHAEDTNLTPDEINSINDGGFDLKRELDSMHINKKYKPNYPYARDADVQKKYQKSLSLILPVLSPEIAKQLYPEEKKKKQKKNK